MESPQLTSFIESEGLAFIQSAGKGNFVTVQSNTQKKFLFWLSQKSSI